MKRILISVDQLPDTAVKIQNYKDVTYDRYWFDLDSDAVISKQYDKYWYVNIYPDEKGYLKFRMVGTDGKRHNIYWNQFRKWIDIRRDLYDGGITEEFELRDDDP